jgi:hypothetical protein
MQNKRANARFNFIDPSYTEAPRLFHWLINTLGTIGLGFPYMTILIPCFAMVWGTGQLQIVFGATAYGTVSALMSIIKMGTIVFSVEMLFTSYFVRHDWEEELRGILRRMCGELLAPWRC